VGSCCWLRRIASGSEAPHNPQCCRRAAHAAEFNRYVAIQMIDLIKTSILCLSCFCLFSGCASTENAAYDGPLPPRVIISSHQAHTWLDESPLLAVGMPEGPCWLPAFEIIASVDSALTKELSAPQHRYVPGKQAHSYAYGCSFSVLLEMSRRSSMLTVFAIGKGFPLEEIG